MSPMNPERTSTASPTPAGVRPIAVYGATGHTGRFVLQELRRRGLPAVAVARRALVDAPADTPARVAALDDPVALDRALHGCAVVINTAGPFLDTARPLVEAALRAGCHYIDVTAEQPSARMVLEEFDARARAAGVVVMPAAGFYGGLADLLASALLAQASARRQPSEGGEAGAPLQAAQAAQAAQAVQAAQGDQAGRAAQPGSAGQVDQAGQAGAPSQPGQLAPASLRVGVALSHWWPTEGTRITGARNQAPRVVIEDGRPAPLPQPAVRQDWAFAEPFGTQAMVELPFSEVVTLAHHLPLRRLHSFISERALQDIRDPSTPAPTAVDTQGRSAQRFAMEVVAEGPHPHARPQRAWATGQDIYAVSAPMVVEAAVRLSAPGFTGRGAAVLGQVFDARAFLDALALEHLQFGIA